jgi:hypothetical protein
MNQAIPGISNWLTQGSLNRHSLDAWNKRMRPTSLSLEAEKNLEKIVSAGVLVSHVDELRDYFSRHFSLSDLVVKMCLKAVPRFQDAQLALDMYHDPEYPSSEIVLYIRQHQYADDILDRIWELESEFEPDINKETGNLLVTTDFQNPL